VLPRCPRPSGRVLVVHANGKPCTPSRRKLQLPSGLKLQLLWNHTPIYPRMIAAFGPIVVDGRGAGGTKASNREFSFSCAEYEAMRDSGRPYSGHPGKNKLLPLPRPTYTEFTNRAARSGMADRLDFLYCPADAPRPPRVDASYERVVWCGVSFRRFARVWTPERSYFFDAAFQVRMVGLVPPRNLIGPHASSQTRKPPRRPALWLFSAVPPHSVVGLVPPWATFLSTSYMISSLGRLRRGRLPRRGTMACVKSAAAPDISSSQHPGVSRSPTRVSTAFISAASRHPADPVLHPRDSLLITHPSLCVSLATRSSGVRDALFDAVFGLAH
jgi:hypothetical protein